MERQSSPFTQDLGGAINEGQETMSQTGHMADQMLAAYSLAIANS